MIYRALIIRPRTESPRLIGFYIGVMAPTAAVLILYGIWFLFIGGN